MFVYLVWVRFLSSARPTIPRVRFPRRCAFNFENDRPSPPRIYLAGSRRQVVQGDSTFPAFKLMKPVRPPTYLWSSTKNSIVVPAFDIERPYKALDAAGALIAPHGRVSLLYALTPESFGLLRAISVGRNEKRVREARAGDSFREASDFKVQGRCPCPARCPLRAYRTCLR